VRVASIDIGTNTILLLVADIGKDGSITPVLDTQVMARLGKGVDGNGQIGVEAFARCRGFLGSLVEDAGRLKAEKIIACGTSALRDALNREDFLDYILSETGLEIEILSGDDEARLSYSGSISGIFQPEKEFAVLDIGGGSTELTVGRGSKIERSRSLDIGCVRITEKFLFHSPPLDSQIKTVREHLLHVIPDFPQFDRSGPNVVGVAGTLTTLAALELGLAKYEPALVSGFRLTRAMVENRFEQMKKLTSGELVNEMRIDPGRADIILAGILILGTFLELRGVPEIIVSERGLRYGLVMREAFQSGLLSSIS